MHNMIPDTSWIPQDSGWLIGYAIVMSISAAALAYLWQHEKDEAEKAEGVAKFFEDCRNAMVVRNKDLKAANKALSDTNAHLSEILAKSYVRNKYGILQAYQDWAINGDKKPKPRKTQAQKIKELGDHFLAEVEKIKERKPMTRAEYVRALLKEAAESEEFKNETWPKSALEQMDDSFCNDRTDIYEKQPLTLATWSFSLWDNTKEKFDYWSAITYSEAVRNFQPKTQWVK
jgi:hypothetical protein